MAEYTFTYTDTSFSTIYHHDMVFVSGYHDPEKIPMRLAQNHHPSVLTSEDLVILGVDTIKEH